MIYLLTTEYIYTGTISLLIIFIYFDISIK